MLNYIIDSTQYYTIWLNRKKNTQYKQKKNWYITRKMRVGLKCWEDAQLTKLG